MKRRIKLCLIAPVPPPYGGIANWVQLITNHITKKQNEIDLLIINIAPKIRSTEGRTLWNRVVDSGFAMIKQYKELKRIIKYDRPDVIHLTTSGQLAVIRDILFLVFARWKSIPTIYHIRFGRMQEIAVKNTIEWRLISRAMKLASEVMVIDNATYRVIQKRMPKVKMVYVPNPIDISNMPQQDISRSKTIVFLGWVIKTKGIEELLSAWEEIYKVYDEWKLCIIGPCSNEYLNYLQNKFSFDGVIYEGEKSHEDAMHLVNSSEIFILPSYTEGFPNVILEAMALSKPVIATRVGAIPDMLADDCGLLINPQDSEDIIEALKSLLANKDARIQIASNANKKLQKNYTIETVFQKYKDEWVNLSK